MCTSIVETTNVVGSGKGSGGWFELTQAVVSYDHPHHAWFEDAITIDFVNPALGPGARDADDLDDGGAHRAAYPARCLRRKANTFCQPSTAASIRYIGRS